MYGRRFDIERESGGRFRSGPFFNGRLFGANVIGACDWSRAHTELPGMPKRDKRKFAVDDHPLVKEDRMPTMQDHPQALARVVDSEERAAMRKLAGLGTADAQAELYGMGMERGKGARRRFENIHQENFVHDFKNFMAGIGKRSDYIKGAIPLKHVGQGRPVSRNPQVLDYIDQTTGRVADYYKEIAKMKAHPPDGKSPLDYWFKYFKYVIRGLPYDPQDFAPMEAVPGAPDDLAKFPEANTAALSGNGNAATGTLMLVRPNVRSARRSLGAASENDAGIRDAPPLSWTANDGNGTRVDDERRVVAPHMSIDDLKEDPQQARKRVRLAAGVSERDGETQMITEEGAPNPLALNPSYIAAGVPAAAPLPSPAPSAALSVAPPGGDNNTSSTQHLVPKREQKPRIYVDAPAPPTPAPNPVRAASSGSATTTPVPVTAPAPVVKAPTPAPVVKAPTPASVVKAPAPVAAKPAAARIYTDAERAQAEMRERIRKDNEAKAKAEYEMRMARREERRQQAAKAAADKLVADRATRLADLAPKKSSMPAPEPVPAPPVAPPPIAVEPEPIKVPPVTVEPEKVPPTTPVVSLPPNPTKPAAVADDFEQFLQEGLSPQKQQPVAEQAQKEAEFEQLLGTTVYNTPAPTTTPSTLAEEEPARVKLGDRYEVFADDAGQMHMVDPAAPPEQQRAQAEVAIDPAQMFAASNEELAQWQAAQEAVHQAEVLQFQSALQAQQQAAVSEPAAQAAVDYVQLDEQMREREEAEVSSEPVPPPQPAVPQPLQVAPPPAEEPELEEYTDNPELEAQRAKDVESERLAHAVERSNAEWAELAKQEEDANKKKEAEEKKEKDRLKRQQLKQQRKELKAQHEKLRAESAAISKRPEREAPKDERAGKRRQVAPAPEPEKAPVVKSAPVAAPMATPTTTSPSATRPPARQAAVSEHLVPPVKTDKELIKETEQMLAAQKAQEERIAKRTPAPLQGDERERYLAAQQQLKANKAARTLERQAKYDSAVARFNASQAPAPPLPVGFFEHNSQIEKRYYAAVHERAKAHADAVTVRQQLAVLDKLEATPEEPLPEPLRVNPNIVKLHDELNSAEPAVSAAAQARLAEARDDAEARHERALQDFADKERRVLDEELSEEAKQRRQEIRARSQQQIEARKRSAPEVTQKPTAMNTGHTLGEMESERPKTTESAAKRAKVRQGTGKL